MDTIHDLALVANSLAAITSANAIQVSVYRGDTSSPSLVSFDLDLNSHILSLSWNEPVLPASFQPDKISITNNTLSADLAYSLTGGYILIP